MIAKKFNPTTPIEVARRQEIGGDTARLKGNQGVAACNSMAHGFKEMHDARWEMMVREEREEVVVVVARPPRRKRSSDHEDELSIDAQSGNKLWLVRHMAQFLRIEALPSHQLEGAAWWGMIAHVKLYPTFFILYGALPTISEWTTTTWHHST